jgi:uncharacterized membrane protein
MAFELIILRLVHILGGIFWVGSALFTTFFLIPALGTIGPAAGQVMGALQKRRFMTVMPIVTLLTILSGVRLMWISSAGFSGAYFTTAGGRTYASGGLAAILSFLLGIIVIRPAMTNAARLGAALAAAADDAARAALSAQTQALRQRGALASAVATVLIIVAAVAMAIARYV